MRARRFFRLISLAVLCAAATSIGVVAAHAESGVPGAESGNEYQDRCDDIPRSTDGSHRQQFDEVDLTGQIAGLPPRILTDLGRGDSGRFCVGFQNRTDSPVDLKVEVVNLGSDRGGRPLSGDPDAKYGASSWVTPSASMIKDLKPGELAWVDLDVDIPDDAVTGSSYASILATAQGPEPVESSNEGAGTKVNAVPSVALQIFFEVPGNEFSDGKFVDVESPRVIWWDGLKLGDLPVLEKMRGLGIATIRFGWENLGNHTTGVSGKVLVESDLGGKDVASIAIPETAVMRGATRDFSGTWSEDIPFIGRFTPTIEVTDANGDVHKKQLDPIWVIPSWWYLLALVLAIAIPLWIRRRNKRQYRELLARVEAAESRDDDDLDSESGW